MALPPMSLVVLQGPEFGATFGLPEGSVVIGRSGDCDIVFPSDSISRKHARITRRADGTITLEDMGSTCGQYVNGARTNDTELKPGDTLQFGANIVVCVVAGDPGGHTPDSVPAAPHDGVSGARTRGAFTQELLATFLAARENGEPLSVLAIDVDRFRDYNAQHGHLAGDKKLLRLCNRFRARLQDRGELVRWSEREFIVLLPGATRDVAFEIADVLMTAGQTEALSLSIGVATLAHEHERAADLVQEGLIALREHAKQAGGGVTRAIPG